MSKESKRCKTCEMMSKGLKEALTVLIVTHVERVERLHYVHNIHLMLCRKGRKIFYMLKQGTNTFLLITFLIFNRFSIRKKFWKAET